MKDVTNKSYLRRVRIEGYKSFGSGDDATEIELKDVNILIGANGSGKSNFISFFTMLSNMMTGSLQNYVGINGTSENLLHYGSRVTPKIDAFSLMKSVQDTLLIDGEEVKGTHGETLVSAGNKESFLLQMKSERITRKL